jgi:molybdopterin-biosynthesis enzyme MoeA-like protein
MVGLHSLRRIALKLKALQSLKRVEVIADDESEITEAVRRMSDKYDFVVTSGGIGPTWVLSVS